jgi:hypothetical protein
MSNNDRNPLPVLAPPGAGLPAYERIIAKMMVRWKAARVDRATAVHTFATEREAILRLVHDTPEKARSSRVLIKRLRGLEDSSRYWSVLMTLDHVRIVNAQVTRVIRDLAEDRQPEGRASTAAVKPGQQVDDSVITAFDMGCRELEDRVASYPVLASKRRFAHPWFGDLDAAGWHYMVGFHMRLHRKQIECIRASLA